MKNSISNGGLFQLSARLARYTYNETYAEWANKIWDWSTASSAEGKKPLVNTQTWEIGDSVSMTDNCTSLDTTPWSYNYGTYLSGAAYMYNYVSISGPSLLFHRAVLTQLSRRTDLPNGFQQ